MKLYIYNQEIATIKPATFKQYKINWSRRYGIKKVFTICFHAREHDNGMWFRVFGYGLSLSTHGMFSDRYWKRRKYFGYYIRPLKP